MVSVPASTPVTTPVAGIMVAVAVLLLLQVPPALASLSVTDAPSHTPVAPVIVAGSGFTVTLAVAVQPVGMV